MPAPRHAAFHDRRLVCLGQISGAHGVRGEVVVIDVGSLTVTGTIVLRHSDQLDSEHAGRGIPNYLGPAVISPDGLAAYGPFTDASGARVFAITLLSQNKGQWLAQIDGVTDRTQAQALAGTRLFVGRDMLPALDDEEFYHADLIGLRAEGAGGEVIGRVQAVHDFGAGDVLELARTGAEGTSSETLLVPFTRAVVPEIDVAAGRLVVVPPVETTAGPDRPASTARPDRPDGAPAAGQTGSEAPA